MKHVLLIAVALLAAVPASAQDKAKKGTTKLTKAAIKSADFIYRKTPQGDLTMHVFYPPEWKESDRRPVIVFFFGGGWTGGSYTQFVPQAEYFASRGLVAACADYRIKSIHKTTPDACVADAKDAVHWLRRKAGELGIDPGKVIASGGSAGGHLAAATALVEGFDPADAKISPRPNALVLFNPALNVKKEILGADGKDVAAAISPTRFLKAGTPPAVIFFGTADKLIEHGQEYLVKAKEVGVRAEMYTAADQGHGFFNRSPWLEVTTKKADEFLQSLGYLKGPATIVLPEAAPALK